jgi:hypothetical protein
VQDICYPNIRVEKERKSGNILLRSAPLVSNIPTKCISNNTDSRCSYTDLVALKGTVFGFHT